MRGHTFLMAVPIAMLAACASYPAPQQRLATSQAALRGAQEAGAPSYPQAALHLRLAQEEIAAAQASMNDNDNERADYLLVRAKADADLALTEARQAQAQAEAQQAADQVRALRQSMNQPSQ